MKTNTKLKDIPTIDQNCLKSYVAFQAKYCDRIIRLRSEGQRHKPKELNGDICMPAIQTSWNGNLNNASKQAKSTKDFKQSCGFDEARIAE
jgi:hypothetical protein